MHVYKVISCLLIAISILNFVNLKSVTYIDSKAKHSVVKLNMATVPQLQAQVEELQKKLKEAEKKQSVPVYVTRDRKLSKFSGADAEDWVSEAKQYVNARLGTDVEKVDFILSYLESNVKTEVKFKVTGNETATWDDVFKIITDLYGEKEDATRLQQKFFSRFQKSDETLDQYSQALMDILLK